MIKRARMDQQQQQARATHVPVKSLPIIPSAVSAKSNSSFDGSFMSISPPVPLSSSLSPPSDPPPFPKRVAHSPQNVASLRSASSESDSSFEIIPEAVKFVIENRDLSNCFPCYLIKPHTKNRRFWPRDEIIQSIENVLLPHMRSNPKTTSKFPALKTFVLHGMGGVGKTEIATEFVFKHKDKYDAIFFLHADDSSRLTGEMVKIVELLKLDQGTDINAAKEALFEWLAYPAKSLQSVRDQTGQNELANWLIVFDNADDPEILLDFWPEEGQGSILVTSRDPMARDNYYFGDEGCEVKQLSTEDGAAFLRSVTGNEGVHESEAASKTICGRLDGLPLAIEQIGALIRRNTLSLTGFLTIYKDDQDFEELQDRRIARNRGYPYSVAGVWALQDLPPDSLALLDAISFLDPDCIHRHLLRDHLDILAIPFAPESETGFTSALTRLVQSSLISSGADSTELRIHRLVQDVARARMRKSNTLYSTFDSVVSLLWTDFPRITRGGVGRAQNVNRWKHCEDLFPHITRLREFYLNYSGEKTVFKSRSKFADLLNEAAWFQYERMNPSETTPMVELAQQICDEHEDDHSEQLALIFGTKTGNSALLKDFEKVFAYATERLALERQMYEVRGTITANLASAYNDKGAAYSMNGLPSKAFALVDESKRLREAMPNFRPWHNFAPLHERSVAHWRLGQHAEAAHCLLKALKERIEALGENDRQSARTGQLYYALGNVRLAQSLQDPSMAAESAKWHQKALVHYRATVGDNHYRTACACYRVAEHYIRDLRYQTAYDLLDQALKVFQSRPYFQQENARTLYLYYEICMLDGKVEQANSMLQRSVRAFNEALPRFKRTADDITRDDFKDLCTYDF